MNRNRMYSVTILEEVPEESLYYLILQLLKTKISCNIQKYFKHGDTVKYNRVYMRLGFKLFRILLFIQPLYRKTIM